MSVMGSAAPGALDAAVPACEPPDCFEVAHGLVTTPPVALVDEGQVVQWRASGGHHWMVEGGGVRGCLGFSLTPENAFHRLAFVIEKERLFALHDLGDDRFAAYACAGAIELPNGWWLLRYQCAFHAREGGVGLFLVKPATTGGDAGLP